AQKYTLTMKATPSDGGSFNTTSTKVSVGERYNLRAYPNTDFAFVAWLCEGDTISKSASYDYTMPSRNVDITGVFSYQPYSPSDPQEQALKYQLSLTAVPMNSGSFNISNERFAVGSNNSLRAYANTDFVFKHWMIGDSVLSSNPNMDFVMPSHNVQMVGVFEYDPASPANPNSNHWNKQTGDVIVDDFTPGNLSSAISSVISGSSSNDVQTIIVSGQITSNDFGIANNFKNCWLLDLSRVTGVAEVPSYAFDYTNLEMVYLPATIEKIGARAFAECPKLSSLTIYAMTPPTLESNVFLGVSDGLVVYVPAAAIALYQDVEAWAKFTLLPIQEDVRSISVSLPEGVNVADYVQMWLELTNTKSGQRMHYVMTDRQTYTFANIIRNTSWNVTLRNERGDVFGQIDNVEVKDEDISVAFTSLSKPQSVVLSVLAPDGQDVTAKTQVTWMDAQGNYLAQGESLNGLPAGYQATYRIVLSQDLAMTYNTPQPADYILTDGNNSIICQLSNIPQVKISGKVKDASIGLPLSGAVVSASQTFGGTYSKTLNARTDANGMFTLIIANVPTSVAFAAFDYVSQTVICDSLLTGATEITLSDVLLNTISGATISIGFTYTPCDGETQNWYTDYQNVSYELFNVTQNKAVNQYNVQFPQIVLLEDVADGDVLRLTASSRSNDFKAVTTTATITEQKAEATFDIVELGKIHSSFATTGNASVVGSLYDAAGKLVKTYDYSNAQLTISDLADGNYTLVSMGNSRLFNTIYDLAQLPQTGLIENVDYVLNQVEVKSGLIATISINVVPTLNESKLYYTSDNTSFTVNKPNIVAGNFLTLTGRIDFKQAYVTSISNVQMIVDLPESCEFVENSVMVGNSTSSYTLNGNRITIPMARYTDRVRFCIIPTHGGEYAPSAFVQFDLNGETVTQPIGSANYIVQDLFISVPSTVAESSVQISGTAIGQSDIEIYDDGMLIGNTTSLANGAWETTCELKEPYNLSTHNIYAKVTTKTGLELISETKQVTYDVNMIVPKTVTMLYYNPEFVGQYNIVFDLINKTVSPKSYYFFPYKSYPNWRGSGTEPKDFTFIADLSNNDSTAVNGVTISVYTNNGYWRNLKAQYNTSMNRWVAVGQFTEEEAPAGVKVKVDADREIIIDASYIKYINSFSNELCEDYINGMGIIDEANTEDEIQHLFASMGINLFPSLQTDTTSYRQLLEGMS
ncbi:MAG: leucine-rich repeat protein, partial [Prevotella sp.]|nr:leucine-rich repeat protein [Prevotella sp.]